MWILTIALSLLRLFKSACHKCKKTILTEMAFCAYLFFVPLQLLFFCANRFIFPYRDTPFDHAIKHYKGRDALNNNHQGAEAEE